MDPSSSNLNTSSSVTRIRSKLSVVLPGKIYFPGDSEYDSSVGSYFFRTARQTPTCILKPNSAGEVQAIVNVLSSDPGVKFAIRSGGHTPNPHQSNVVDGVTIDLRSLNEIARVGGNSDVLSVGTGAKWGDVYDYLEKAGRAAVGSRESSVGVGGFITGGGLSFFAPELGFASDNVVNMEIVTPRGILCANANEHVDLFRAVRGGQGNFGIITRFDIKTHERNTFWGGGILYPESTEDAQLQAWSDLKNGKYDPRAAVVQSYLFFGAQKSFMISNNMVYLQEAEHPVGLAGFENIQPQVEACPRASPTSRLNEFSSAVYVTTTVKFSPSVCKRINSVWRERTLLISDSPNITSVLTYQQFPLQNKGIPNSLGLHADDELHKDHLIVILSIYWHEIDDSERITKVAKDTMDRMEAVAAGENALHTFKYINYAAYWQQPARSYGEAANEAAREVSAKYDPQGVFRKQAVGFKFQ
ncbi:hypothetical protein SLS60_011626 [Paraconiothyrium brasiliense]|uniref:FAD-binding PCMH-type domain-containing protein n=1 Tax=Paraconiothyrium brasiliense TaxID=300254 RepID=A0ABR3QJD8_9PLEO